MYKIINNTKTGIHIGGMKKSFSEIMTIALSAERQVGSCRSKTGEIALGEGSANCGS